MPLVSLAGPPPLLRVPALREDMVSPLTGIIVIVKKKPQLVVVPEYDNTRWRGRPFPAPEQDRPPQTGITIVGPHRDEERQGAGTLFLGLGSDRKGGQGFLLYGRAKGGQKQKPFEKPSRGLAKGILSFPPGLRPAVTRILHRSLFEASKPPRP